MRPWQHAISSSRDERSWIDDLAIHEFLDMTKACCADRRHRMILHNSDLGVQLAGLAFPERDDAGDIAMRHVTEDLGHPYTLADWLDCCALEKLPKPMMRRLERGRDGTIDLITNRLFPEARGAVEEIYDILSLPAKLAPDHAPSSFCVLMNAAGPPIVRRLLGPPREVEHPRGKSVLDPAWIAEALIFAMFGRITDLGEVVRCCISEPGTGRRS